MNKDIWSRDDALSVRSDVRKLDKLDTAVQRSSADERNTVPSRMDEPREIRARLDSKARIFQAPAHTDRQCR